MTETGVADGTFLAAAVADMLIIHHVKCVTCYVTRESLYYFWEKFLGFDISCFDCMFNKTRKGERVISLPR